MSDDQDQMIKKYLSRVIDLSEQQKGAMSEDEMRAIARDVGLSDEDLARADRASGESYQRGVNFLKHGRPGDAIRELEEAVALAPNKLDYRATLARAFRDRWQRTYDEDDRQRALKLANECLRLDPDHSQSYELINQLDAQSYPSTTPAPRPAGSPPPRAAASSGPPVALIVGGLGVLFVAGFGAAMVGFLMMRSDEPEEHYLPPEPVVSSYKTPKTSTYTRKRTSSSSSSYGKIQNRLPTGYEDGGNFNIPVVIENNSGVKAKVHTTRSFIKVYKYTKSAFYETWITIDNDLNDEIYEASVSIQLLDRSGKVLFSDDRTIMSKYSGQPARPGDTTSYKFLKKVTPELASAKITVNLIKTRKAGPYKPEKVMKPGWAVPSQKTEKLVVIRRSAAFKTYKSSPKTGYFKPIFAIENKHDKHITKLKLRLTLLDSTGKTLEVKTKYVVGISDPPIRPGERRVIGGTYKVDRSFKRFRVDVLNMKVGDPGT